jgi:hypothetical protein
MPKPTKMQAAGKATYLNLLAHEEGGGGRARKRDVERARNAERALVLKDYATRARQQTGATLYGTVHCELLDYYTTIELQKHFAQLHLGAPPPPPLQREDVEDIAKGYGVDALIIHRPEITLERVVAHARDVYPSLRKAAAQRSAPLCRPREDGEAFDPAVHIWDVGATRLDWAEKYEAAYGGAPPRIERYSDKVKAQEALEERERRGDAEQARQAVLHWRAGGVRARLRRNGFARRGFAMLPRPRI